MLYKLATRLALARAHGVATVSHATRADVQRHYGVEVPAHHVIRHSVDPRFGRRWSPEQLEEARRTLDLPPRYVLHVGVHRPHKNQAQLVRAFARIADAVPDVGLVLVGGTDERFPDPVPGLVEALGLQARVRLLRDVSEPLLPGVYQAAAAFAFPSFIEGFGLPILEAMAGGTPVVASDTPAVVEACEGGALLVAPSDTAGLGAALLSVLADAALAERLRRKGREVADRHSWDEAGQVLVDVLARASTSRV